MNNRFYMEESRRLAAKMENAEKAFSIEELKVGVKAYFELQDEHATIKAAEALKKGLLISFDGGYLTTMSPEAYFEYASNGGLWSYCGIPAIGPFCGNEGYNALIEEDSRLERAYKEWWGTQQ